MGPDSAAKPLPSESSTGRDPIDVSDKPCPARSYSSGTWVGIPDKTDRQRVRQARTLAGARRAPRYVRLGDRIVITKLAMCSPAVGPTRAPAGRSSTATATTRRDHVRPAITAGQRRRSEFWHPTCVLKWSGDDVEDRQHEACCTSDGGGPSGFAVQAEIPNHRKLRRLRAGVVSVAVEVPRVAGQVCDEKTNVCEPLLTHRKKERWHRNRTVWGGSGTKARFSRCALSRGAACVWPWWCPVYRWRELVAGAGMEQENLSSR